MYKTVRHGENSLQYKILAQQEEGLTNVRSSKFSKILTLKLVTVVILLIVGIILSAVLVPLLLTNDFFTLTGAFQKFSVSTIRRTHSGNHVVLIAKKPFGWMPSPHNASTKVIKTSHDQVSDNEKVIVQTHTLSTNKPISTIRSTSKPSTIETTTRKTTPKLPETTLKEQTVSNVERENLLMVRPTPTTEGENIFQTEDVKMSSTLAPVGSEPVHKGNLTKPLNKLYLDYETFTRFTLMDVFVLIIILVAVFMFFMLFTLRKKFYVRRALIEKETAESKEDKARLLKPSARGSDEE